MKITHPFKSKDEASAIATLQSSPGPAKLLIQDMDNGGLDTKPPPSVSHLKFDSLKYTICDDDRTEKKQ